MTPQCCGCLGHHPRKVPLLTQPRSRAWLMFGRDKFETCLQQSHGWTWCWDRCCWVLLLLLARETLNEEHYVVTVNNNEEKIYQLPAVWRWPAFFSTVCHCTHPKQSKTFFFLKRVDLKNLVQTQRKRWQILQEIEGCHFSLTSRNAASCYGCIIFCTGIGWKTILFPVDHSFLLQFSVFLPYGEHGEDTVSPPHHTWIHQSLGHVIACGPRNFTDGSYVIIVFSLFVVCTAPHSCMYWVFIGWFLSPL